MRILALLILLLSASACDDSGLVNSGAGEDGLTSPELGPDVSGIDAAQEDASQPDTTEPDLEAEDTTPISTCEPGEGCFGEPCTNADDCLSGICTMHLGDQVCSKTCDEACPQGWACTLVGAGGDGQYVCLSTFSHLCLPCESSEGCTADKPNACVKYQDGTSFCGGACDVDTPCPSGYACEQVETANGAISSQCVNTAGVCPCSNLAMIMVNLIDTYWVSRLGTQALAAVSFAFPIQALVINISLGLMIGTSVVVAQAIGGGKAQEARRLTTDASVLAVIIVLFVSGAGLLFQDELFTLMGAEGELLESVKEYMTPWFIGIAFLVVPMIANGALRAQGDAKTPMRVMMFGAALNAIFDPLLIFGWGPIPAMGLQGAAIATVLARFIAMLVVFYILINKAKLLDIAGIQRSALVASWKRVGRVAIPAIITNAVGPLAVGILTGIVAMHGPEALAAWGIGARVDAVLLLTPFALSGAVSPFVGQNWGAHLHARVAEGLKKSLVFVLIFGAIAAVICIVLAPTLASAFSDDIKVQEALISYLQIIPIGYAFIGMVAICSSAFNAVDRATRSSVLSVLRSLGIAIPAAMLGNQVAGLEGLFLGLVVASLATSSLGVMWMRSLLFPFGSAPAGVGKPLGQESVNQWLRDSDVWTTLEGPLDEILGLDNLKPYRVRGESLGFFVGSRELAHLTPKGHLDLPLPFEIGDNLVCRGVLEHHPDHDDNGWHRFTMEESGSAQTAAWLLGLSHLLYSLSERGEGDPITQAEMDAFTESPRCVNAMRAAAARWKALPEPATA